MPGVRMFISHCHDDGEIVKELVGFIRCSLEITNNELKCTSVPGYTLEVGAPIREQLRKILSQSSVTIALITNNSINSRWVIFELGAAWVRNQIYGGPLCQDNF